MESSGSENISSLAENSEDELIALRAENADLKSRLNFYESLKDSPEDGTRVLEKILQATPDIIYIFNLLEQRYIFANRQVAESLGYSPSEIQAMGQDFMLSLLHSDDLTNFGEIFSRWDHASDVDVLEIQYRLQHKNGDWLWFHARDKVFSRDANGKAISIIGTCHEISVWKSDELRLKHSIQEKETLLREVHHRVKNNLNIILSLLFFQKDQLEGTEPLHLIENIETRIFSIALVHNLLFENQNLNSIRISEYIAQLVRHIHNNHIPGAQAILIKQNVSDCTISLEQAQTCGLILNELIINSLRHAFANNQFGEIEISFQLDNGQYIIEVSDNGKGFVSPEVFKSGSGLFFIKILTEESDCKFEINNKNGTHITIRLPVRTHTKIN